ncbi:hypothetical protein [Fibrella forsythiae]|uniref:Uncharacterized protein n=1 Tax=Fibrella forsythiae TaxID=2817061 RepID=A0ABS3JBA9_9BACT|nr:hypothetical protein [Fibrella forsythiae]MBO0947276.1 hypothetical protein [Fibrella forsythiae]
MNSRQNYGSNRADSNSIEEAVKSADFLHFPLLTAQGGKRDDEYFPSEVELVHSALVHYRAFLAQGNKTEAKVEAVDELIRELRDRAFEALSNLSSLVNQLNERRS